MFKQMIWLNRFILLQCYLNVGQLGRPMAALTTRICLILWVNLLLGLTEEHRVQEENFATV